MVAHGNTSAPGVVDGRIVSTQVARVATRFPSSRPHSPSSSSPASSAPPRGGRPERDDRPAFSTRPRRDPRDERGPARAPERSFDRRDDRDERFDDHRGDRGGDRGDERRDFVRNDNEQKVAGENACRALFMQRPDDIRRVYVTDDVLPRFKDVLRFCAERKLAYHVKTDADLDQIAETVHHDGVLFLAKKPREPRVDDVFAWIDDLDAGDRAVLVLLENVKNPHNLGAILRVCAHFGVPFVLRAGETPASSPAVLRTAEGGAEHTGLVDVGNGSGIIDSLKDRGFKVLATSSHATVDLGREALPPRTVVLFGAEGEGLTKALQERADGVIAIPGSGALESLNVACAASVVLWELWREATMPSTASSTKPAPRAPAPRHTSPSSRAPQKPASKPAPRASRWD